MEQRPLRLGDIVDDYCPRERRITNHAIVALVGEAIRQTRCTTCDAEHLFKAARMPKRKKPDAPATLYDQVLAEVAPAQLVAQKSEAEAGLPALAAAASRSDDPGVSKPPEDDRPQSGNGQSDNGSTGESEPAQPDTRTEDVWAAHRPLIRATLPRTENDPPTPRPIPEFTMHQRRTRGGHAFRQGGWQGQDNGNVRHNGFRPGRSAHGHGQGQNHGNGPGPNRHESGGRSGRRHAPKNKRPR
ncbi:MAG TPA: hypothetical protein VES67_22420 [Vicinamibacterales bacterium]|nr:hypothetical protein [Vicinamibacterales bacterium]